MPRTTVLMTCAGGALALDILEALRADRELDLRLVGADARAEVPARHAVDAFATVPSASKDPRAFAEALLDRCQEHGVDIVLPGADEEVLALAQHHAAFAKAGITCAVQELPTVELLRDKLRMLQTLHRAGVPLPSFAPAALPADLPHAVEALGYPGRPVLVKPNRGRGARGIVLVDPGRKGVAPLPGDRAPLAGDLPSVVAHLTREGARDLLAMEFLPGPIHDVDCVAVAGAPVCLLSRRRLWDTPFSRGVEGHEVVEAPAMEAIAERAARLLRLRYVCDFDFGTAADGAPGLLEINPRWSGSVAAGRAAGVNVPAILVRSILGRPLPKLSPAWGARAVPVTRLQHQPPR